MNNLNEDLTIKLGTKTIKLPDLADEDITTWPFDPEDKATYKELNKVLVRKNLKIDWFKAAMVKGKEVFVAGVGAPNKPFLVWVCSKASKGRDDIITKQFSSSSADFLSMSKILQTQVLAGEYDPDPTYKVGDVVKMEDDDGGLIVATITQRFSKSGGYIFTLKSLPLGDLDTGMEFVYIPAREIVGRASEAEIKAATKTYTVETLPRNIRTPDKYGNLYLINRRLVSLKGCPTEVKGSFNIESNFLTSLVGGPRKARSYCCKNNSIAAFDGVAAQADWYDFDHNKITSLVNIHHYIQHCETITIQHNPIESGWLHLFLIKGIDDVEFDAPKEVLRIFKSYLPMGKAGMIKCQLELISNGYEKFAKL